jgi:RNA polymerase sigma-70 factor (ECF subfamily)
MGHSSATAVQSAPPTYDVVASLGREVTLLHGLQRGDAAIQARVFRLYKPSVRRLLVRILHEGPDVADALQDTFFKVFKSASQVNDPVALHAWILRIAESVALDEFRRRQRLRLRAPGLAESSRLHAGSAVPLVEVRSALRDAYRVLAVLPEEEQRVFTLRRIDGLELAEIADTCALSLATVKRRLGRAASRFSALARRQPALTEWVAGEEGACRRNS